MNKILTGICCSIAVLALQACNSGGGDLASTNNASDVTSGGSTSISKAVCTSSNNWQSVGIGMSASQVQDRLGAPSQISSSATATIYVYEACRGFRVLEKEGIPAVPASGSTPAKPAEEPQYGTINTSGTVTISGAKGVLSVASPERIEEKVFCEWNYYDYPYAAGQPNRVCRTAANQF